MLTEEEVKELKKLSPEFQKKIIVIYNLFERVKKSHLLSTYLTTYKQKKAWQDEIDNNPFLIRGNETELEVGEDGVVDAKQAKEVLKEAITSRQNVETAMKLIKLLPELDDQLEKMYIKMTVDEKQAVERVKAGEAETLLDQHLKSKNGIKK
jgi:hypothetical protein